MPHGVLTMITGVFFLAQNGQLEIVEARIEFDSNLYATADRTLRMFHVIKERSLDDNNFGAYGVTDIANEYASGESERSQLEMRSSGRDSTENQLVFANMLFSIV